VVRSEPLQDCVIFRVSRTLARSPRTGDVHSFHQIRAGDWVNVVPVTGEGELVLVRQYRHGCRRLTLEIPGGMIDPGETPDSAAARELVEETGYRADRLESLGWLNPNPALFDNRLHLFLAPGAAPVAEIRNDAGTEETSVELVPVTEIERMIADGRIHHALVIAALFRWRIHAERARG